jgi:radical SAM superfamily enzyme YgiQ (UPF0313 family)
MRILLTLPFDLSCKWSAPDLGLGYLASALQRHGHQVDLCLHIGRFDTADDYVAYLRAGGYDIVGIKTFSSQVDLTRNTIARIRQALPQATVLVGGPHTSADPKRTFVFFPTADYAFQGEAEIGLPMLVDAIAKGDHSPETLSAIPGLIWRDDEAIKANPLHMLRELDELAFPAWDLMPPASFPERPMNGYSRRFPIAPMLTTRGCPHRCTFCGASRINGYRIRARSAENVMAEIRMLTQEFSVREIQFYDSNCASRRGPLREVTRRLIEEKIDITWSAPNGIRLDSVDEELVSLMKASGCYQVNVGIESGSQRILHQMAKSLHLETVRRATRMIADAGIEVVGLFMLGLPGETREDIQATVNLALELPLTGASFSIYCPLPGTEDYERLLAEGILSLDDVNKFDMVSYENHLSELSPRELRRAQRLAYLRFHLRPKVLRAFLRNLSSLEKIRFVATQAFEKVFE